MPHKIFIIIGLFFLSLIVIGLFGSFRKKQKRGESGFSLPDSWKWSIPVQAAAAIALITIIGVLVFQKELTDLWSGKQTMVFVIIAASLGLLIGGDSLKTINVCRKIALIVLISMVAYFGTWSKWGPPPKPKNDNPAQTEFQRSSVSEQLPAGAVLAKTLAPGGIVYMTREDMSAPPPKRWAKYPNGAVLPIASWPDGEEVRFTDNPRDVPVDVYYVGRNITVSDTPPEKKLAKASVISGNNHLLSNVVD